MIGVWVCCGDRRWAVGLQWVLFGFAVFGCGVERVVLMVGEGGVDGGGGVRCA